MTAPGSVPLGLARAGRLMVHSPIARDIVMMVGA
jgi:hypothetical protein